MGDYVQDNLTMEKISEMIWTDYLILMLIIMIPLPIGLYYCFAENQQNNFMKYTLGGRNMSVYPVAFSLAASFITSLTITGIPAEVYMNGSQIWLIIPSMIVACIFSYFFFLPVFYELDIVSAYHYLGMRFNNKIRFLFSTIFIITNILILPTFIYAPSLLLSEVSGINIPIIATGIIFVCLLYAISGFKAVVWTGFAQTIFVALISLLIVAMGTYYAGDVSSIFKNAYNDGKMNMLNIDPNPFKGDTFWTITFGTFFIWSSGLISSQISVQKFMALHSIKEARTALIVFISILTFIISICVYGGYVLYTAFYGCDPNEQNLISRPDEIMIYFILNKMRHIPCIVGVFMAGIILAAMSYFTNALNAIAHTIYEDYFRIKYKSDVASRYMMISCMVIIALYTFAMVACNSFDMLSTIIPIYDIAACCISSIFIMGMLIPMINSIGAASGIACNVVFITWISIGSILTKFKYYTVNVYQNISSTCVEESITQTYTAENDDVFIMYELSHMLYLPLGLIIGIIVAVIVSYFTGATDSAKIRDLISPPIRWFLPKPSNYPSPQSNDYELMMKMTINRDIEAYS